MVHEKKIFYFFNLFLLVDYNFPMGKDMALHLNKLKSPSPKEALCQVWLKLTQCFLREYFFCHSIFLIWLLTLLEKGCGTSLEQT